MDTQVAEAIVGYLQTVVAAPPPGMSDTDPLTVAIDCISASFGLSPSSPPTDILTPLLAARSAPSTAAAAAPPPHAPALPRELVDKLTASGYFAGTEPGSAEYAERMATAAARYAERVGGGGQGGAPAPAPADEAPEDPAAGEAAKKAGNALFGQRKYADAIAKYSDAIAAYRSDATYFNNRAACYLALHQYDEALEDCKQAVAIDPEYVKAYRRMGTAYMGLGKPQLAIDMAYEPALAIEPDSPLTLQALDEARRALDDNDDDVIPVTTERAAPGSAAGAPPAMPAMPGLAEMMAGLGGAGGAGGMPDLSSLMSNPMVAQMAQQMASNPEMLQNLMGMMGNMGAGQ